MSEHELRVPHPVSGVEIGSDRGPGEPVVVSAPIERYFRLSPAAARLLRRIDGRRTIVELAVASAGESPAPDARQVSNIVDRQLVPLGLVHFGTELPPRAGPRSALWLRVPLIPWPLVARLSAPLISLFRPAVAALVVSLTLVTQWWFFSHRGGALGPGGQTPASGLVTFAWFLLGTVVHEFGHAAALSSRGERPGVIGCGVFGLWPVMFSDVSRSWRLAPRERAVVDIGGIYFQLIACAALIALWAVSHAPALAAAIVLTDVAIAVNFNPLLRWDGYWLLTDLAGLDDFERQSRAGLRALLRGRREGIPWLATLHAVVGAIYFTLFAAWAVLRIAPAAWREIALAASARASAIAMLAGAPAALRLAGGVLLLLALVVVLISGAWTALGMPRGADSPPGDR